MADSVFSVNQGSLASFALAFTDENGAPVVPATFKWSLRDDKGIVVNSRLDVNVPTPVNPYTIVLNGPDTEFLAGGKDSGKRVLGWKATYVSLLINPANLNGEFPFTVVPLQGNP